MTTCSQCQLMADGICTKYNKEPPPGMAVKCRHFVQSDKPEPDGRECTKCARYDDGWCLRLDNPDWKYNFIKIKANTSCLLEE